jgi:hypothetical protein
LAVRLAPSAVAVSGPMTVPEIMNKADPLGLIFISGH